MPGRLELTRSQIVAFRRRTCGLDRRLPPGAQSLRAAAWAGLQDSMPRAALLSIHARVHHTRPATWTDPSLVQVWGPRFSAYVVADADRGVFTLGRLPDDGPRRARAEEMANRLDDHLDGRRMTYGEAGRALGIAPNALRYAAPTGRVVIRWDGARQPTIWTVPAPSLDPYEASLELARRYLHVFGPATVADYAQWAGVRPPHARATFEALSASLVTVDTPIGDAVILATDEAAFHQPPEEEDGAPWARLLPSGDAFTLLQGRARELLVPEPDRRSRLWTPRVWPGALLVDGEVAGTWRRAGTVVTIEPWRRIVGAARRAVEAEAESFPLPEASSPIRVTWSS